MVLFSYYKIIYRIALCGVMYYCLRCGAVRLYYFTGDFSVVFAIYVVW